MTVSWNVLEGEWRKQLLAHASGNILEVGVGEGINFKYYPPGVNVIATDMSAKVIEIARKEAIANGIKAEFIAVPANELSLEQHSFDTIISTFSLSAFERPGEVLEQFNTWSKPDGRILLLEYGLSKYGLVNWLQRKWEPYHYKRTGSHINRDMLAIISGSNLRVRKVEVKYAGIVYLVWASLGPGCR